jgi:hypothetical protein
MDMVRTHFHLFNGDVILLRNIAKELLHPLLYLALQYIAPVLRRPDQVVQGIIDGMGGSSEDHTAIVPPSTSVWQRASSPLPNALIPPRRKQRGSLSAFRAQLAKEEIDKWIEEIEATQNDLYKLGLAAFAKKNFGEASKLFNESAESNEKKLEEIRQKERGLAEKVVRDFRLAGDAHYNNYIVVTSF